MGSYSGCEPFVLHCFLPVWGFLFFPLVCFIAGENVHSPKNMLILLKRCFRTMLAGTQVWWFFIETSIAPTPTKPLFLNIYVCVYEDPGYVRFAFSGAYQSPRDLVRNEDSDSVGLGWGLRFCIPSKLSWCDACAAGPGATLGLTRS